MDATPCYLLLLSVHTVQQPLDHTREDTLTNLMVYLLGASLGYLGNLEAVNEIL